ncbi:MAG: M42 family metallopeptidase [Anaerolineaceae bacterium]
MKPRKTNTPINLDFGQEQIALLEKLSNAGGVSGDEGEVRDIVLERIKDHADETHVDALGNVLAICKSKNPGAMRVMVAAHMDEVGLMLVDAEEDQYFQFVVVGGIDPRQLAGKTVLIGKEHVKGVIGAKPIHLTTSEERGSAVKVDALRIDVGPDAAGKVKAGDRAVFATRFCQIGPSLRGKALDDRLGVASLINLVQHAPENVELLAAFTVMEEIGGRGARVGAYSFDPEAAFVIDCTPAHDLPVWDEERENLHYNTRLDHGPAIYSGDNLTLSDPRLIRHLLATAEKTGLPCQMRQPGGGGTDAGAIHRQRSGIPSVSLSVPGRNLHTAVSLCRLSDWQNSFNLLHAALSSLERNLLAGER